MNDLRNYLNILENVKDLLSCLPETCESYTDTFYGDINYLIDKQYDKMYEKLEIKEGEKNGKRNGTNF